MTQPDWYLGLSLGLLLGVALLAGLVARMLHLPSVTAYLLVGLALGPHTPLLGIAEWVADQLGYSLALTGYHIPDQHFHYLEPIGNFAIALVLFNMGCHFPLSSFRRIFKRLLPMSLGELGMTMMVVTCGMFVLGASLTDTWLSWQAAALLGALALATAPATTVLVLKEIRSEGPLTEFTIGLLTLNNLAAIVVFEFLFVMVYATRNADVSMVRECLHLTGELVIATLLGVVAGIAVSFFCGILATTRWLLLLTAVIAPLMAICELWQLSYLLMFLTIGTTVASTSDVSDEISGALDSITGLLCVVFFVIHGAEMDLGKLWAAGAIGAAYITLRCVGKYVGVYLAVDPHRDGPQVKRWLGARCCRKLGQPSPSRQSPPNEIRRLGVSCTTSSSGRWCSLKSSGQFGSHRGAPGRRGSRGDGHSAHDAIASGTGARHGVSRDAVVRGESPARQLCRSAGR